MLYVKDGKLAQDSDGVIRAQTFRREEAGRWDLRVKSSNADATWKKRKKKSSVTVSSFSGQESLRRNGVAIMVNKRVQNAVLECNLKNDRMISVRFQGKPFNMMVIQVYALTSKAEEAEVEQFYEDL